jgi:hypothetical protein
MLTLSSTRPLTSLIDSGYKCVVRRALLTGALVLTAICPTPAAAAPQLLATERAGVWTLALDRADVFWVATGARGDARLRMARAGAAPRTLARLASGDTDDDTYAGGTTIFNLGAAAGRVVFSTRTWDEMAGKYTGEDQVAATSRVFNVGSRTATTVVQCSYFGSPAVAITPSTLVTTGCGQPGPSPTFSGPPPFRPQPVELRDLASPAEPLATLTPAAQAMRAAGRVVAWWAEDALVAFNLDTSTELLRLPLPYSARISGWDVQADGKLAYAQGAQIVWAAPGQPAATIDAGGPVEQLRLAGDKLAFVRRDAGADALVVRGLQGSEQVLARFGSGSSAAPAGPIAFDGERVAFTAMTCDATRVLLAPPAGAVTETLSVGPCPVTLDAAPEVTPRGRLRATVTCPRIIPSQAGDRCRITARATRGGRVLATARANPRAERSATLRFSASRRLARERPRRLRITVRTQTRAGVQRQTVTVRPSYG